MMIILTRDELEMLRRVMRAEALRAQRRADWPSSSTSIQTRAEETRRLWEKLDRFYEAGNDA